MNENDDEPAVKQIRAENARLLEDFAPLLRVQRRAPSTIRKHLENVEFYARVASGVRTIQRWGN